MRLLSFLVLIVGLAHGSENLKLPTPPNGFTWQILPEMQGALLKPDGWHYKTDSNGDTVGHVISKEKIEKNGQFLTGLTFQCIKNVPQKSGMPASTYIKKFADEAATSQKLLERREFRRGAFECVQFRYVSVAPGEPNVEIVDRLMANEKTGSVFLVIFEAPEKKWDAEYRIAEVILKQMVIDEKI